MHAAGVESNRPIFGSLLAYGTGAAWFRCGMAVCVFGISVPRKKIKCLEVSGVLLVVAGIALLLFAR